MKFVVKDLLAKLGINIESVAATPNALADSMTTDYTPEQWAKLEGELDRIYDDFMSKVAAGRRMDKEAVHQAAKGQVWTGVDAKARGLVDELGGLDMATAVLKRLAKLDPQAEVNLQQYPPPSNDLRTAISNLASGNSETRSAAFALVRLVEAAEPLLNAIDSFTARPDDRVLRAPLP